MRKKKKVRVDFHMNQTSKILFDPSDARKSLQTHKTHNLLVLCYEVIFSIFPRSRRNAFTRFMTSMRKVVLALSFYEKYAGFTKGDRIREDFFMTSHRTQLNSLLSFQCYVTLYSSMSMRKSHR